MVNREFVLKGTCVVLTALSLAVGIAASTYLLALSLAVNIAIIVGII